MIHSIQFLRGIASLLVVLLHISSKNKQYDAGTLDWLSIGNSGVDLFFIISGFIMCYTTYNREINFSKFIKARLERILPLYWLFTGLALGIYIITPHVVNTTAQYTDILASFLLLPTEGEYLVLTGWTLRYEFYFYFIFSAFLIFNSKKYWIVALSLLAIPFFGSFIEKDNVWSKFIFDGLIIEFAFGILAFYLFKNLKINKHIAITLITAGVSLLLFFEYGVYDLSRFIYYGIPMLLIFFGFINIESFFSNKTNPIIKFIEVLGNSSYSIYITHIFVLKPMAMICSKLGVTNSFLFAFILLLASILFGIIVYYGIEKPINNFIKKRKENKKDLLINQT